MPNEETIQLREQLKKADHEIERLKNPWVDIKERQPRKYDGCIVCGGDFLEVTEAEYAPDYGSSAFDAYVQGCEVIYSATHWMPLPRAPKD